MKIFFGTQTEGNGHLTQAIALKQYFAKKGQNIDKVFAANKSKGLSSYFTNEFNVIKYDGFDFVFDQNGRMVVYKTILKNLFKLYNIYYLLYIKNVLYLLRLYSFKTHFLSFFYVYSLISL